jgi:hypothetical protein
VRTQSDLLLLAFMREAGADVSGDAIRQALTEGRWPETHPRWKLPPESRVNGFEVMLLISLAVGRGDIKIVDEDRGVFRLSQDASEWAEKSEASLSRGWGLASRLKRYGADPGVVFDGGRVHLRLSEDAFDALEMLLARAEK